MVYWSFPAINKSNKGKEKLFVRKGTRGSSGPSGEAASINQLCSFIEKSSLRPAGGKPKPDGGWEKGAPAWKKGRHKRGWRGDKVQKKRSLLAHELDDDASPDYVPNKRRSDNRILRKATQPSSIYTQPDQRVRGTGPSQRSLHLTAHHTDVTLSLTVVGHQDKVAGNVHENSRLCLFSAEETICRIRDRKLDMEGDWN